MPFIGEIQNRYFHSTMQDGTPKQFRKCDKCGKMIKTGSMYYRLETIDTKQWVSMHVWCLFPS